jgi:hypothetical protein
MVRRAVAATNPRDNAYSQLLAHFNFRPRRSAAACRRREMMVVFEKFTASRGRD